jgi:DNA-binding transcriptional ArsR family regulator
MSAITDTQLDLAFAALSDPTRRRILSRLARGDATVTELAEPFDMTLPAVSKHIKVLERGGLISRRRHQQLRPCHLELEVLDIALDWIEEHRRIWSERFDKLDTLLDDLQRKEH